MSLLYSLLHGSNAGNIIGACGIMAITSAFQADDVGSIPTRRSKLKDHTSGVIFFVYNTDLVVIDPK